jgi:hypothetical protein
MRRVSLSGTRALEIRAEVFNATNTPPLDAPNTQVGGGGVRDDQVGCRSPCRAAGLEVQLLNIIAVSFPAVEPMASEMTVASSGERRLTAEYVAARVLLDATTCRRWSAR